MNIILHADLWQITNGCRYFIIYDIIFPAIQHERLGQYFFVTLTN